MRYICSKMFTDLNIKYPQECIKNCCKSNDAIIPEKLLTKQYDVDFFIENPYTLSRKADMIFLNKLPKNGCDTCINTEPNSLFRNWNRWNGELPDEKENLYKKDMLTTFELVLSSSCDLKCIYCGTKDSSSWALELGEKKQECSDDWKAKTDAAFFSYLDKKVYEEDQTYTFFFSGGEVTYNPESIGFIETVIQRVPNDQLIIIISTNGNTKPKMFDRYVELLNTYPNVRWYFDVSLDGVGKHCEAIRTGLNWERAIENISKLHQIDNARVRHSKTINLYSIPTLLDDIKFQVELAEKYGRLIGDGQSHNDKFSKDFYQMFNFNMVQEPPFSPMGMPEHYKHMLDDTIEYCAQKGIYGFTRYLKNVKKLIGTQINEDTAYKIEKQWHYFKRVRPQYDWDGLFPHVNDIIKELKDRYND